MVIDIAAAVVHDLDFVQAAVLVPASRRWWLRMAKLSIISRLISKRCARISAVCPMDRPTTGSVRPRSRAMTGLKCPGRRLPRLSVLAPACACACQGRQPVDHGVVEQDGCTAHGLHAAGQHQAGTSAGNILCGRIDGLHAGGAITLHRPCRHAFAAAQTQCH